MGLSPKPLHKEPTLTWKELDDFLQFKFSEGSKAKEPTIVYVDPDKYVMTSEEIFQAGLKNNYKVSIQEDGIIKFE